MHLDMRKHTYVLSSRDLVVMAHGKNNFKMATNMHLKLPQLPPIWSRLPYLMLVFSQDASPNLFWKAYREFSTMLKARNNYYLRRAIPKLSGGRRQLLVPSWPMARHQQFILKNILRHIPVSEHACAYCKGRGLVDLAKPHVGNHVLLHLDIQDFFSSITEQMVFETLIRETGYPKNVAGFLARLCCYRQHLPQGACTSPALSNICFKPCDDKLSELAKHNGLTYSRYSDDMYFSGDIADAQAIVREVKAILDSYGFRLNTRKTKILGKHQAQKVTSITVNEKMQVSRQYRRDLRQEIHYLRKFGENCNGATEAGDFYTYLYQLLGRIAFVLYVDPDNKEFLDAKRMILDILDSRMRFTGFLREHSTLTHLGSPVIHGYRVDLEPFRKGDGFFMYRNWAQDPEVTRYLTWHPHKSQEESEKVVSKWVENYQKPDFYQWAIRLRKIDEPIGSIGVVKMDEEFKFCELGYCIGKHFWHQGYTTEALKMVLKFLFVEVGFDTITACHDVRNPHSGAVMRKCGMRYVDTRENIGETKEGEPLTLVRYAIDRNSYLYHMYRS